MLRAALTRLPLPRSRPAVRLVVWEPDASSRRAAASSGGTTRATAAPTSAASGRSRSPARRTPRASCWRRCAFPRCDNRPPGPAGALASLAERLRVRASTHLSAGRARRGVAPVASARAGRLLHALLLPLRAEWFSPAPLGQQVPGVLHPTDVFQELNGQSISDVAINPVHVDRQAFRQQQMKRLALDHQCL